MMSINTGKTVFSLCAFACLFSCGPSIRTFMANRESISCGDTVNLFWDANGTTSLVASHRLASPETAGTNDLQISFIKQQPNKVSLIVNKKPEKERYPENLDQGTFDCPNNWLLYITLNAAKGKKEARKKIKINVSEWEKTEEIELQFSAVSKDGDSILAHGTKITENCNCKIKSIKSEADRILVVRHDDYSAQLEANEESTSKFNGEEFEGEWHIATPITAKEREDYSLFPDKAKIIAVLLCGRYKRSD